MNIMNKQIQVHHHLGLGDHIICNGLIRELCKHHERVYCYVKEHYLSNVSFMYRDEPRVTLLPVKDSWEVPCNVIKDVDLITIGFDKLDVSHNNFDHSFYKQLGYDPSLRWENFHVEREYHTEQELFRKLNPHNVPYIFIHDDPHRGYVIDPNMVRKDMKIITASDCFTSGKMKGEFRKYNIFHWILVMENATEVHCMDSSFKCLMDSLPNFDRTILFYHSYVRGTNARAVSSTRRRWIIIKQPSLTYRIKHVDRKIYRQLRRMLNDYKAAAS